MEKKIIGIGEILWDIFPKRKVLGGAPANFAYHVSQLGFEGFVVSSVGNDPLGFEILHSLHNKHLNNLINISDFPTGTVHVVIDQQCKPNYKICRNVAWDNIPFTEQTEQLAYESAAVCFGSLAQRNQISRKTIINFLNLVQPNCLRIFDINLRQDFYTRGIIKQSIEHSDVVKMNEDEVIIVGKLLNLGLEEETEICMKLLKYYNLKYVILTKGPSGSFIFSHNETSFLDSPKIQVADTVGAGDAFTAAFIASLLKGHNLRNSHQFAVDISAYVCTKQGAMPRIPDKILHRIT